jgi:hypothetical protein
MNFSCRTMIALTFSLSLTGLLLSLVPEVREVMGAISTVDPFTVKVWNF